MSLDVSATQRRIDQQLQSCHVYLHKPTGIRYCLALAIGGDNELHPISGKSMYASDEQLSNAEVWERQA
ncbi:hypothetical protein D9M68_437270 [compost metagenome]